MEDAEQEFKFEGNGTLVRIDTFTAKSGKEILTLIIRTGGEYPQLVPIKIFGRLVGESDEWKPGNVLQVKGHLGGRDWNGKVYGDIVASAVRVLGKGSANEPSKQTSLEDEGPPF